MAIKVIFSFLLFLVANGQCKGKAIDELTILTDMKIEPLGFNIDKPRCQIPTLDLFSPTVQKFYDREPDFFCDNRTNGAPRPAIVTQEKNYLYINYASLPYYGYPIDYAWPPYNGNPPISCSYQSFQRQPANTSDDVSYSAERPLSPSTRGTKITAETDEFITVICRNVSDGQIMYKDYFAFLPPKPAVEKRCDNIVRRKRVDRINPVIIGLDSLSRLQFHRQLPQTYQFLHREMNAIEMEGYNKVAENTYPNLVPLLTGLSAEQLNDSCLFRDERKVDKCPLIWKYFHSNGFRTVFVEDAPDLAIFNWGAEGFSNPPTDYYVRPFYLQSERNIGFDNIGCGFRCLGPKPSLEFLLDHAINTVETFQQKNYFGFFWSCSATHDTFNIPIQVDHMVTNFLRKMKSDRLLNNTVLIVMSDHGPRLRTLFRLTEQGQYEKRLPLLTFVFPEWFEKKYSLAISNLRHNAQNLATHFDLHQTLFDFMDLSSLTNENLRKRYGKTAFQGQSLFLPISENRTCETAHIPVEYCACNGQGLLH